MIPKSIEDEFRRDVCCLLGLPFDAVNIEYSSDRVIQSALSKEQCVISTPNLNFIVNALTDSEFRDSVISSELSLLDGMPLLWVAKLIGSGVKEKVSGSDLFDYISRERRQGDDNLTVFFFGGEEGAAKSACEIINAGNTGVSCVGYLNPGFGSIESLSSTEILDQVNRSQADFLVVALGAKKGQLWIERNRGSICPPVVSHLGAVINFVAGNIKRAPPWMQRTGLEWTWRIVQEPNLWRRYLSDGLVFSNLFLTKVLPYVLWMKFNKKHFPDLREPVEVKAESEADKSTISISGNCFHDTIEPLRAVFADQANSSRNIVVDLSAVPMVDGAFLGLCLILFKHVSRAGRSLSFSGLNSKVVRVFHWNCVEFLL